MGGLVLNLTRLLIGAVALSQLPACTQSSGFEPETQSSFETGLIRQAAQADSLHANLRVGEDPNNARGLALSGVTAAVVGLEVSGRKYGISLDGTGEVLIKDFVFTDRRAKDIYGSGLMIGQKQPTRGQTWLSNAWIDLKGRGPIRDYKQANNEPISVEAGSATLNVRRAVLIGGEESGLDNKGDTRMDGVFIASGHRSIRIWAGARLVIANSIILANPGHKAIWFGGDGADAQLEYFNCLFGTVGDRREDLTRDPPASLIEQEGGARVRIQRLEQDPFARGADSFWTPTEAPTPPGYFQ